MARKVCVGKVGNMQKAKIKEYLMMDDEEYGVVKFKLKMNVIDRLKFFVFGFVCVMEIQIEKLVNAGFCDWEMDGIFLVSPHTEYVLECMVKDSRYRYTYCPKCGKRIRKVYGRTT